MLYRCALGLALCAVAAPSASANSVLTSWNLIVRNSVTSSSEVDGSALIGGNLTGASNYTVQTVTAPGNVGLAVGGNVSGGPISVNNGGNFRFAGTVSTIVNTNGGGNSAADATIPTQVTSALAQVASISSYLSGLSTNGTLDGAGNLNAVPTNINGTLVAVYSITPAQWSSLGQLNLNIGSAQSVIINVPSAGSISFVAPPNLIGGFSQSNSSRILWNIPNATSISVNNTFNGALIAPNAALSILGGGVNGSVVVDSIPQQLAEIRRFTYNGFVPTPAGASLLALAGLAAGRRRRR
ncbi:MAG: choice-of-anchor A family protein [Phycisphaerales bacterium]|nr:choice-of-anchor A family protein [Phycisphaerales bacterium]